MTCKQARELLMELEPAAFASVEHLQGCERCRAFAERLREVDSIVAQRVEQFASRGNFEQEWAAARATVAAARRRPVFRNFFAVAALAAAVLLTFRLALLPVLPFYPLALISEPNPLPVPAPAPLPALEPIPAVPIGAEPVGAEPSPPASVPPAYAPEPALSPPKPRPRAAPRPSPARTAPVAAPPVSRPKPAPAAPLSQTRTVTITLPPSLSSQPGILICPSARIAVSPTAGGLRFEGVPVEICSLKVGEITLPGVGPEHRAYRVEIIEGKAVLISP